MGEERKTCGVEKCGQIFGLSILTVKMWAKGWKKESHPPMELSADLPICVKHREAFWEAQKKGLLKAATQLAVSIGKRRPDPKTVETKWVSI